MKNLTAFYIGTLGKGWDGCDGCDGWAKRERKEKASSGNLNKFLNLTNIMK